MQLGAVTLIAAPVVVLGFVEFAPALVAGINAAGTTAVGTSALSGRAISAGADLTGQLFYDPDLSKVNVSSVTGSFVFGNPLAGAVVGNIFQTNASTNFSTEINNPLSSAILSRIMLGATLGVFSDSFSGLMNQIANPFGGILGNQFFSGTATNIIANGANETYLKDDK